MKNSSDALVAARPGRPSGGLERRRRLTAEEFQGLAEVPAEAEWFANIRNLNTRRAYRADLSDFMNFAGIEAPEEFRIVARAHVIAWRDDLERRDLAAATIRRKLSALSSLYKHLCDSNAVAMNPTQGVSRPTEGANQGKTPAIADGQALRLLNAPPADTLKGLRDRAILSVLLFHGLRREELCLLRVKDIQDRFGVPHLVVRGKGEKLRYIPMELGTLQRIREYLDYGGVSRDRNSPIFQRIQGGDGKPLNPSAIDRNVVRHYAVVSGIDPAVFSPHTLRATAATNALEGGADLKEVQEWLGHANVATTVMYDRRRHKPEDSPTFKVNYKRRPSVRTG